jgi:DNA-binding NarL/FixJ family response regulator
MSMTQPSLTTEQATEVKRMFRVGFTDKEIAVRIGCRPSIVSSIRNGRAYVRPGEKMDWPAAIRSRTI